MAAGVEGKLCATLKEVLSTCDVDTSHLKVCRKVRDLKSGDFVVPRGALNIDIGAQELSSIHIQEMFQQVTAQDSLPIATVTQDQYNSVVFHVNREKAFRSIISKILTAGDKYGCVAAEDGNTKVILNPVDLGSQNVSEQDETLVSLTQLRCAVLMKHIQQLLMASGCVAEVANRPVTEEVTELLEALGVEKMSSSSQASEHLTSDIVSRARASEWKEPVQRGQDDGDREDSSREPVVLNFRRFIEEKRLTFGKTGFDKNMHLVDVTQEDGTVSDVAKEAAFVDQLRLGNEQLGAEQGADKKPSWLVCVHLVSQSLAFRQQQAHLLWQISHPDVVHWNQFHQVFGTVGRRKSSTATTMDAKEFYNMRYGQMTQAAMMKYGDHDQGPGWEDMIRGLTAASITFDILGTACSSQLHLDLSEDDLEGSVDNRNGPFVMYNCARLATLINTFEENVQQGSYPQLPDPSQINFTLLREEEEWTIAFLYLDTFPQVVQDAAGSWQPHDGISTNFQTHKVTHFLLNFAKVLSSYYSRYHILGGSDAHLLPLMFARLSLMKAVHQVLCNGLRLLGLQPFSQL